MVLSDVGLNEIEIGGKWCKDRGSKCSLIRDGLKGCHPDAATESIRALLYHNNTGYMDHLELNSKVKLQTLDLPNQ
eukprot:scaffold18584_cov79-Cyclotella_meneghiniana.AAC.4